MVTGLSIAIKGCRAGYEIIICLPKYEEGHVMSIDRMIVLFF